MEKTRMYADMQNVNKAVPAYHFEPDNSNRLEHNNRN